MLAPTLVETVGALAATLTTICWLPQALRTIRTRETRAISLLTQAIFAAGLALWLVYGIGLGSWPIIIANALTLGLVAMILALKLRYG